MNKPKVSVLIPAYNHEKFLKETIESVLNQTFPDFELLISDDCSTDNTAQVIKSFSDERITGIFFEKNRGTVRTLNHLLSIAKGEYIAVLGSDDVWELDKLEQQLEVLENDKSLAACFTWASIIDQDSKIISDETIFPLHVFNQEVCHKGHMLREFFMSGNHLCHSGALIRSDIHRTVGCYNVAYRQLHDFDLWVRFLLHYDIQIIKSPLVKYRYIYNSDNVSQGTMKNNARMYNEAQEILFYLLQNIKDEDFIKGFSQYFVKNHVETSTQIACEKFLLLKNFGVWGQSSASLAMRFLFCCLNDEMLSCLENDYEISMKDIYDYTAAFKSTYQVDADNELEKYRNGYYAITQQIEEIYNSSSWKVTRPLRIMGKIMKRK